MTVKLNESGYDTGMSFEEACKIVESAGFDSPLELGYSEDEVVWVGGEYARSTYDQDWPEEIPYWYTS